MSASDFRQFCRDVMTIACLVAMVTTTSQTAAGYGEKTVRGGQRCGCPLEQVMFLKKPPMTGRDIQGLQETLARLRFYDGRVDGAYGPGTALAVSAFQAWAGLAPSGVMNASTWRALGNVGAISGRRQASVPPPGRARILVDTVRNVLTVYRGYAPVKEYVVATGKLDKPTPLGEWKIVSKDSWGEGFGTRWMGLSVPWGVYGIHGTNKPWEIGGDVSSGCVRMFNHDIEELFEWVEVGTPVKIVGHPLGALATRITLEDDYRGSNVFVVQRRLREAGFYKGSLDGVYGLETMEAVKAFQKARKLPPTGSFDLKSYEALNLIRFE